MSSQGGAGIVVPLGMDLAEPSRPECIKIWLSNGFQIQWEISYPEDFCLCIVMQVHNYNQGITMSWLYQCI